MKRTGVKSIPSVVQLPGGLQLRPIPFKIVEYNPDGTAKLFELQPVTEAFDIRQDNNCVLFAQESWIRSPMPGKATT
jgi:hypothetical protein